MAIDGNPDKSYELEAPEESRPSVYRATVGSAEKGYASPSEAHTKRVLESRQDNWTELKGLRIAFVSLVLRSLIAAPLWAAIVWAITPVFLIMAGGVGSIVKIVLSALGGVLVAIVLSRRLTDRAGMVSPIITFMALCFMLVVIIAGSILGSIPHGSVYFGLIQNLIVIVAGGGMIVFKTVMDE